MPSTQSTPRDVVARIDARHEELIRKLDELNARIEAALAEHARSRNHPDDSAEGTAVMRPPLVA